MFTFALYKRYNIFILYNMRKESLDVYERPEAEEVELTIESTILSGNMEDPNCPTKTINPWSVGDEETS